MIGGTNNEALLTSHPLKLKREDEYEDHDNKDDNEVAKDDLNKGKICEAVTKAPQNFS
jgi:hypothetical protein